MINFSVSLPQFFVIAFGNFILSWLFYSPGMPWFRAWQIGIGGDINKKEMIEDKKSIPRLMIGALVSSFLLSYGFQIIIKNLGISSFISGVIVGIVLWISFVVTHSLNTQFEGRKPIVLIINNFHYLITYALYGGILAIWS